MMEKPDMEVLDRRIKWALLMVSLLTLVFLAAAAVQENLIAEWRIVRGRYARILREKATDDAGREIARQFENRIMQNVIPALNITDRCITCHPGIDDPRMADQEQPYRTHPGDYLEKHPPEQYGCTICHQGQGRATVFADAKAADVHWDYPLLPKEFAQSSCAMCHAPDAIKEYAPLAARGYELFVEKGCYGCHKVAGVGGAMGLPLDTVGVKKKAAFPFAYIEGDHTIANWHIEHLMDPQKIVAGSTMKNYNFTYDEALALTNYILSLRGLDLPMNYIPKDRIEYEYHKAFRKALPGEELYKRYCYACHQDGLSSHYDPILKRYIPTVRNPAFTAIATDDFLKRNIEKGRPGRDMPAWEEQAGGLREDEILNIVAYLRGDTPLSPDYDERYRASGNPERGAFLYERNCAGCHGETGHGIQAPALANRVFQESATDAYIKATIERGRHGTTMTGFAQDSPSFAALTSAEIEDLVTFVKTLQ